MQAIQTTAPAPSYTPSQVAERHPVSSLAKHIQQAGPGDRAALARLTPQDLRPHEIAALARALLAAGLSPDTWQMDTWAGWALVAHGMALAGHDGKGRLGKQLAEAGVAESRVTKLLTARGNAFRQVLPRLLRLLASHGVSPNWNELSDLVLRGDSRDAALLQQAEERRLRIAGDYFTERARLDKTRV